MKNKEKDWVDKYVENIESWGVLSLMLHFNGVFEEYSRQIRTTLFFNQGRNTDYSGSPLEAHDILTGSIRRKFEEQISKLEKLKEEGII